MPSTVPDHLSQGVYHDPLVNKEAVGDVDTRTIMRYNPGTERMWVGWFEEGARTASNEHSRMREAASRNVGTNERTAVLAITVASCVCSPTEIF